VIRLLRDQARVLEYKIAHADTALQADRDKAWREVEALKRSRAPQYEIQAAERTLAQLPATPAQAVGQWQAERDDLLARAAAGRHARARGPVRRQPRTARRPSRPATTPRAATSWPWCSA
jgi:hypothetical protein